jgi:hypothetical protein
MPQPVGWLTKAEMDAMLKVPDRKAERRASGRYGRKPSACWQI